VAADLDFIKVVGRFGLTAGDGGDPDEDPDIIWCDEGTVRLTPVNTYTKVSGASPIGWSAGNAVIEATLDSSGYMTRSGLRRVSVVDMTSSKVNPVVPDGKATHTVQFVGVKAAGTTVGFGQVNVRIAADTVREVDDEAEATALGLPVGSLVADLVDLMPVPTAGGTPIVQGPRGVGIASLSVVGDALVATLDSGAEVATDLPATLVDSDAFVADRIETPATATRTALDAAIASATQTITPLGGGADDAPQINAALTSLAAAATRSRLVMVGDFSIGSAVRLASGQTIDASRATVTALANCGYLVETAAMASILLAPRTLTATPATTGGTLAAGTYYYRVSATTSDGKTTVASLQVSATTTGSTGSIALSWQTPRIGDVTRIVSYQIWRGTSPGVADTLVKNLTAVAPAFDQTVTFTDTGATPDGAGTFPVVGTTFARTSNIAIIGGIWDCNAANNIGAGEGWQASRYIGHGFNLQKVDGLVLRDLTVKHAYKWAIAVADFTNLVTDNLTFDTGSDGIHVLGPGNGWRGRGFYGHTGDDLVGMSLVEWPNQTASEGDIVNVDVADIQGVDAPSAVRMLMGTNRRFDAIKVHGIKGEYTFYRDATTGAYTTAAVGVAFLNADNNNPGRRGGSFGRVEFADIHPTAHNSDVLQVDGTGDELAVNGIVNLQSAKMGVRLGPAAFDSARPTAIKRVTISDPVARHANAARGVYVGQTNTTVEDLIINRPAQWQTGAAASTNPVEINAATVRRVKINDAVVVHGARPTGNNVYLLWCAGSAVVEDILIRGAVATKIQGVVYLDTGTYSKVTVTSSKVNDAQAVVKTKLPVSVFYDDLDINTIDSVGGVVALFSSGATPVTVSGAGLRRAGSEKPVYRDGTQVVTTKSLTTEADLSVITKSANAMAYNTNSGLSCGVGPVVCDGTSWKHLFTGATY